MMQQEISFFISRWKQYLKKNKKNTAEGLKSSIEAARARCDKANCRADFEEMFERMQYEKGVKIVFDDISN